MRVFLSNDPLNVEFPEFLLTIGDGTFEICEQPYYIKLPPKIINLVDS